MIELDARPADYFRGRPLYAERRPFASAVSIEPKRRTTKAGLAAARGEVTRARDELHRVAARLRALRQFSDKDVLALRSLYKQVRYALTPEAMSALAEGYRAEAARLRASLPVDDAMLQPQTPVPTAAQSRPCRSRRRGVMTDVVSRRPQNARREREFDELTDEEKAEQATAMLVAALISRGETARAALRAAAIEVTPASRRWAQRQSEKYRAKGQVGDGRRFRNHEATVMTPPMRQLLMALWSRHRGCTARGVELMLKRHIEHVQTQLARGELAPDEILPVELIREGGPLPTFNTIKAFIARIPRTFKTLQAKGGAECYRQERATVMVRTAVRPNEEWQADNTPLDIVLKHEEDGVLVPARPYLTASIDVHSEAIPGWVASLRPPDAWTHVHLLRNAILPNEDMRSPVFGVPERIVFDHGMDFEAQSIQTTLNYLKCNVVYCREHNPDEKPHIERWFRTITTELLPTLPGYTRGPLRGEPWTQARLQKCLTLPQLREQIANWISRTYHQRVHETTGEAPAQRWTASAGAVQPIAAAALDELLLKADETRKVVRGMIRFTPNGNPKSWYFAPELASYGGRVVQVRYNPDDLESVLVYEEATGRRIGEAWLVRRVGGHYSPKDIIKFNREYFREMKATRRSLEARLPDYFADASTWDRPPRASSLPEQGAGPDDDGTSAAEELATAQEADALRAALRNEPELEKPAPSDSDTDTVAAFTQEWRRAI